MVVVAYFLCPEIQGGEDEGVMMAKETRVPEWLEVMIRKVIKDEEWPAGRESGDIVGFNVWDETLGATEEGLE